MRRFIAALGGLGLGAGAAALAYATRYETRQLDLDDLDLPLPGLPAALDGLTVLHLSDFHAKPNQPWHHALIERAAAVPADLVCLTGDYGDRPQHAHLAFAALRKARGRLGTFAVLGNHDLDTRRADEHRPQRFSVEVGRRLAAQLEAEGVTVLDNEAVRLCVGGAPLWIVGVADPHTFHDDVWRAYQGVPADEPSIFLAHSWEPTPLAAERGARLALTGHSHGGQIRLPRCDAPVHNCYHRPPKNGGLSWVGDTALHVSHGLGGTFELRFLVRPHAVRFTLRLPR